MCGFLGEYSFNNKLIDTEGFAELLVLSKHRGPDSTNIVSDKNYRLGFNRLALLDLSSAGEQPRRSPSKRYHIVYNGEVYNYKELIGEYSLQNLESTSDTEVVLQLLDKIGVRETIKVLNGMFAMAIVDIQNNDLYLARDFAGIKPLFFGVNKQGAVFASQFDQLFKHPFFSSSLKLRPEIVHEYFAFGYMAAPNTIYENIFQANPGELIKISSDGSVSKECLIHFPKEIEIKEPYDLETLKSAIKKSVGLQLNTDRSLATFLSGGIDSSLVSSYAKEQKSDIQAFTLSVKNTGVDEAEFARSYAKHLKIEHHVLEVDETTLVKTIEEHFEAYSEPFGDYSSIPTYMVTKKSSERHTSMLSGDGGDELFWGYTRMLDLMRKAWWFKLPLFFRKNLVRITNRAKITNTYAPFVSSMEEFWKENHIKIPKRVLHSTFKVGFSEEVIKRYSLDKKLDRKQLQHFLRWNEFYGHLQRILIKVDRASMRNGLEVRIPFLDKNVIEQAWAVFFAVDTLDDLKSPLKSLLKEKIPQELIMEEKKGFSVPIELWFRNQLRQDLIEMVLNKELYGKECFDQDVLKTYVQDFLDEKHNNGWGVWHIYAWQKWAARFVLF